jgi:hypothetical protein
VKALFIFRTLQDRDEDGKKVACLACFCLGQKIAATLTFLQRMQLVKPFATYERKALQLYKHELFLNVAGSFSLQKWVLSKNDIFPKKQILYQKASQEVSDFK